MRVTQEMKLKRALKYLAEEQRREKETLESLEGIHITEVIIARNKKQMYLAEINQIIRKIETELKEMELGA